MTSSPGVLLVWSGRRPHFVAIPIPPSGVVLGRDLLEKHGAQIEDDRISRRHAEIEVIEGGLTLRDTGSRNGTHIDGSPMAAGVAIPIEAVAVVRTGRSVWVVVPDIARYENAKLTRLGRLVVGGSLGPASREVEAAAHAGLNLALIGTLEVGRGLAAHYVSSIGGRSTRFSTQQGESLQDVLARDHTRSLVLELTTPLPPPDLAALQRAIETELRIATVVRHDGWFEIFPPRLTAALTRRKLMLPSERYDELSATAFDLIRDVTPAANIHASVIERVLVLAHRLDEDRLLARLRSSLIEWRKRPTEVLRAENLDLSSPDDTIVAGPRRVPPGIRSRRESIEEHIDDPSWFHRRLCPDGACHGVIDEAGTCQVCGRVEPLGDPYR